MIHLRIPPVLRMVCGLLLALLGSAPPVQAQALSEAQIKAGFIYNFARYIEWPAEAFFGKDANFVMCLVGRDTLGTPLDSFDGRTIHGHPVVVRRMGGASEDFRGCHVLFVSESEQRRAASIVRASQAALLTVSDIDGFIDMGGGIGLVNADERIQFEINLGALRRASLKASSQLLKLARNSSSLRGKN
ncbi:MAG: YfiR family protein [Sterolibacteriaceae bacterium]|uniref:YfiR family protein n=1 Tax=Candidatus Methylophosphatis roskildensis TaxID=2899263 RepID=A0A9D7E7N3_9PROT|nr:YfiR family protein [Candidatus Methylophosphatis roskildensis]